jgi:hypothetical protein
MFARSYIVYGNQIIMPAHIDVIMEKLLREYDRAPPPKAKFRLSKPVLHKPSATYRYDGCQQ